MNKRVILLIIFTLVGAISAFATDLRVSIPFDFSVGDKTIPAGEYSLVTVGNHDAVRIHNLNTTAGVITLSQNVERLIIPEVTTQWMTATTPQAGMMLDAPAPVLNNGYSCIFTKYGDKYFLSKMWFGLQGREFKKGNLERQLMAGIFPASETVTLIASIH